MSDDDEVYDDENVRDIRTAFNSGNATQTDDHPFFAVFRKCPNIPTITGLVDFIIHISRFRPRDLDSILLIARHAQRIELILPTVYWSGYDKQDTATFNAVFNVDLKDKLRGYLEQGPSERPDYLAASLLSGRCIGLGVLCCPETVGAIADGVGSDGDSEEAKTQVAGACLQLLGGYSELPEHMHTPPGNIINALKKLNVSEEDEPLLKFTIANLGDTARHNLSSEEIVSETSLAGWKFWNKARS